MARVPGPLLPGFLLLAVSGCGDAEPVAPPPAPPALVQLIVLPNPVEISEGDTLRLGAAVVGRPAARLRWSTVDPGAVTVDSTGLLEARRCPTRGSTVVNVEVADDPEVRAVVPVFIWPFRRLLQIQAVRDSATGEPTNLTAVAGTVIIQAGPEHVFECGGIDSLVGEASGVRAGQVDMRSWTRAQGAPLITWGSAARVNGIPVYPNGNGVLTVQMYLARSKTPIASNAVPIVIANP